MIFFKNLVTVAAVLAVVCVSLPSTQAEEDEQQAESKMGNQDGVAQYMGYGGNGMGYGYVARPNQNMVPPYPYGGNQGGNYYGGNGYPQGYNPGYNQGYNPNYPINNPGYNPGYPGYSQYAAAEGGQADQA